MNQDPRSTVLIVDDVPANIRVLQEMLKNHFRLLAAIDGKKALGVLHSQPVDLVFMDVAMPVMDGFEACEKIKSDKKLQDTPVVFISSKKDNATQKKGLELGASAYVTKPVEANQLVKLSQSLISPSQNV